MTHVGAGPWAVVFSAGPLDDGSGLLYVVLTDAPRSTLAGSIGGSATLGLVAGGGALGCSRRSPPARSSSRC
jgi:hypothetical protein